MPPLSPDEYLEQAQTLFREAQRLLAAAQEAGLQSESMPDWAAPVAFASLPERSRYARAEALFACRRIRDQIFSESIFGEPAWDILLDLFLAERSGGGRRVEAVCKASQVSVGTALRYLACLRVEGLVVTFLHAANNGVELVRLSPRGRALLSRYFEATKGPLPARAMHERNLRIVLRPDAAE